MMTVTTGPLTPANIPLALDAHPDYAVQQNWFIADGPFDSLIDPGWVLERIVGTVTVTASADNARAMLVRFYKPNDAEIRPLYFDLGYLDPGESGTFPIDADIHKLLYGDSMLFGLYFNQNPAYRTRLTVDALSLDFHLSNDGSYPEPEPPKDKAEVFVHTLNAGRGKWSRYRFPFPIDAFSQLSGDLFIRSGDTVVKVKEGLLTDHVNGANVGFDGKVQWPWIDAGAPGATKQMIGFDLVASGAPLVSFGFNQSDLEAFTAPYPVPSDTMTGGIIPMPLMAPSFSLRLDFAAGSAWNVRSATLYLNDGKWQP